MKRTVPFILTGIFAVALAAFALPVLAETDGVSEISYDSDNTTILISTPEPTQGMQISGANVYTTKSGNVAIAGSQFEVTDPISKDLLVTGGKMVVKSDVQQDMIISGGAIEVDGNIYGDLLAMGGVVIVNGNVYGDVRIMGGEVYINSSMIGGDLLAYGGSIYVYKNTDVWGETLLNGNASENKSDNVFTGIINPVISLDDETLPYYVDLFSTGTDNTAKANSITSSFASGVFSLVCDIVWVIGGVIAAFAVIKLFPVYTYSATDTMRSKAILSVFVGAVTFITGGILAMILLVTIVGIPLLGVLAAIAILAALLAGIFSRFVVGRWIMEHAFKVKKGNVLLMIILGYFSVALVLWLIGYIPLVGGIFSFLITSILFYWGIGAMVLNKFKALK